MSLRAEVLPRSFYARAADDVARALVGCTLVRRRAGGEARVRIVETEAYLGDHDRASHARHGRTRRNEVMFGPPGYAYVYLVYGLHYMLNVVTGQIGEGAAVLLRAAEAVEGVSAAMAGPGRLTRALGVDLGANGADLCAGDLVVAPGPPPGRLVAGPRVGVDYAGDWSRAALRYYDPDSDAVSRPR